jgi:D-alanine-D-alanine ligase
MDKSVSKRLLVGAGMPMATDMVIVSGTARDEVRRRVAGIEYPRVVKPVAAGSSFATSVVETEQSLLAAVETAVEAAGDTMIEQFLPGVEVTCGVLGGGVEPLLALAVTEIVPAGDGFFDFHAKYTAGACREVTPARIDADMTARIQDLAVLAHSTLGCEGCSRSDFIIGSAGPVMLELNTIPGMTETSLLPQGAAAVGIDFAQLVERLIASALAR